jgi:hypothetical protein
MNVIADALRNKKPLHIVYSDIKGAFPSVPYQAFTDALTALGLDGPFLDLIQNTQKEFSCIAKGPTRLSSPKPKENGVHEGDCLSPTLFCLVINMYFLWLRSNNPGYELKSADESPLEATIKVPVNGYADDMALIGNSRDEAASIFQMLERFLAYYGMELNATTCGYQYLTHNKEASPQPLLSRWGKIPILHNKTSYKYLGYYINTALDFTQQYKAMLDKMTEVCAQFYSRQKQAISLHEAIHFVNSDLISKLRCRMYLVYFPKKILKKLELARVAASGSCSRYVRKSVSDVVRRTKTHFAGH